MIILFALSIPRNSITPIFSRCNLRSRMVGGEPNTEKLYCTPTHNDVAWRYHFMVLLGVSPLSVLFFSQLHVEVDLITNCPSECVQSGLSRWRRPPL